MNNGLISILCIGGFFLHDAIAVTCSTASMGFALEEEYFPNQPPSNESVVQRPSHVVLPKIVILLLLGDFTQK